MGIRLTVLPHEYDYAALGKDAAQRTFASLPAEDREYIQQRPRFNRECDLQDMAEKLARKMVGSGLYQNIFGSNRFGLLATKGYGEFEEVFMRNMESYLQKEHETKLLLARQEKYREYHRLQRLRRRDEKLSRAS